MLCCSCCACVQQAFWWNVHYDSDTCVNGIRASWRGRAWILSFIKKQSSLSRQLQYFFFFLFFIEFEYFSNFVKFCTMKLCDYIKIKMSLIKRLKPRARVCLVCYFTWRQKRNSPKFSFFISRYSRWQASACDGAIFGCGAILDFHAQLPVGEMVNIPGFNPSPQWLAGII